MKTLKCKSCPIPGCGSKFLVRLANHLTQTSTRINRVRTQVLVTIFPSYSKPMSFACMIKRLNLKRFFYKSDVLLSNVLLLADTSKKSKSRPLLYNYKFAFFVRKTSIFFRERAAWRKRCLKAIYQLNFERISDKNNQKRAFLAEFFTLEYRTRFWNVFYFS